VSNKVNQFQCKVCKEIYETENRARDCEKAHDTVYIPFSREELFRLVQYIYSGDQSVIPESLTKKLIQYKRGWYQ
jgi:hypothetical protein